jgi:hypothetical protein
MDAELSPLTVVRLQFRGETVYRPQDLDAVAKGKGRHARLLHAPRCIVGGELYCFTLNHARDAAIRDVNGFIDNGV